MLCCAALCRAVLCCAVLRSAALCCAVLCCAVLCCAALCCAVLCCALLCCAALCCALLRSAALCCAVLRCADFLHFPFCGSGGVSYYLPFSARASSLSNSPARKCCCLKGIDNSAMLLPGVIVTQDDSELNDDMEGDGEEGRLGYSAVGKGRFSVT